MIRHPDVSQRWKRWSDGFDNLMTAMNITDNARKKALLLQLAGEAVYGIFQGLVADVPADADQDVDNPPNQVYYFSSTLQARFHTHTKTVEKIQAQC